MGCEYESMMMCGPSLAQSQKMAVQRYTLEV